MSGLTHPIFKPNASQKLERSNCNTDISSDDESYAGVEQISDSEEDEPDVEKAEERAIIFSEARSNFQEPFQLCQEDTWHGFSDYPNFLEDIPLFGHDISDEFEWRMQDESIVTAEVEDSDGRPSTFRAHSVDFESSDDEIEMFDDVFPDIFIDKDKLDSSFRRQIDREDISDDGSYWEHEDVETMYGEPDIKDEAIMDTIDEDAEYDSDSISSGHETDMSGETTDDDLPDEYYTQPRRSTIRMSEIESDNEGDVSSSSPACTPRLYSWKHTSNKPFATVSTNCKKMILFNVQQVSRHLSSDRSSQQLSTTSQFDLTSSPPMKSSLGNILMAAIQNPYLNNLCTLPLPGTSEAFIPEMLGYTDYNSSHGSTSDYDTDDVEELCVDANVTNLDEFINFESDDGAVSDDEAEPTSKCVDSDVISSTPARANSPCEDQVHPLIPHFNRGVVGSWRQKQNTHQLLHRNIASQDSLAFGGNQFMEGTLKGVKSGRLKHASTPITPVRKQRLLNPVTIASNSLASPMKRKLDVFDQGLKSFKRSRTLM